jgi:glutathione synthase/RimK-type ligase-like ATP-grasp enzyme
MKAYILRRKGKDKTSCFAIRDLTGFPVFGNHKIPKDRDALCIRWGCGTPVPTPNVINSARSLGLVSNKTEFRKVLSKDQLCPETWFGGIIPADALDDGDFSVIVRPSHHHSGEKVYHCKRTNEAIDALKLCGQGAYVSKYIPKVAEFRVFCAQGRAFAVARKIPADENAIAWNVDQGGKFEHVKWSEWPLKVVRISLQAFGLSGLDFGGVDAMVDRDGNVFILEINSAMTLTSEYRQKCFAKVISWMVEKGREPYNIPEEKAGYTKFIHPALDGKAKL